MIRRRMNDIKGLPDVNAGSTNGRITDIMEDKQKMILNLLLNRYEKSTLFKNRGGNSEVSSAGSTTKSPAKLRPVNVFRIPEMSAMMEDADEKSEFLASLESLRDQGIITFSWMRYEEGNIPEMIWLNTDEDALEKAYHAAGRFPLAAELDLLRKQISKAVAQIDRSAVTTDETQKDACDVLTFLAEMLLYIDNKKKVPKYFFSGNDRDKNEQLIKLLMYIAGEHDEQMIRVVSQKLFGDSKYFEHKLKSRTVMILRHISQLSDPEIREDDTDGSDEEEAQRLLAERGIVKWPQVFELRGNITLHMTDGSESCLLPYIYGACLNSATVSSISHIDCTGIRSVISIENKANYTWYLSDAADETQIVLYTGGFFSPARGQLFRLIAEGCKTSSEDVSFMHWGDIDLGGFRIFLRLRREIFPDLKPYMMDIRTLEKYNDRCVPLGSSRYRASLEKTLDDRQYTDFHDVTVYMLEHDVRLEQEAEIW